MKGFEDTPTDWAPATVWVDDGGVRHQSLQFIVAGRPVQKGNIIKSQWGAYHDATKGIDEWLAMVSRAATVAMAGDYRRRTGVSGDAGIDVTATSVFTVVLPMFTGAVMVDVTFVMPRLKKHGKKDPPPPHVGFPDCDKLFRSIGDAMTGIVFNDDKQIVEFHARKRYGFFNETPGVIILVTSNVVVA